MKVTLEPRLEFENINGLPCQTWTGFTDKGTPVVFMVATIGLPTREIEEAFVAEMASWVPPGIRAVVADNPLYRPGPEGQHHLHGTRGECGEGAPLPDVGDVQKGG